MPTEEETAAAAAAEAATKAEAARVAAEKAEKDKKPPWGDDFDPAKAWSLIEKLREDNKSKSANDATIAAAVAAGVEKAQKELNEKFAVALGLKTDDKADPVKLAADLVQSQADAKSAAIELAVFRAADAAGAVPSLLLDSRTFMSGISAIDPTDAKALQAAIEEAVKTNPLLAKTDPTKPLIKPFGGQGGSGNGGPSLTEQIAALEKEGNTKGAIRLRIAAGLSNQSQ